MGKESTVTGTESKKGATGQRPNKPAKRAKEREKKEKLGAGSRLQKMTFIGKQDGDICRIRNANCFLKDRKPVLQVTIKHHHDGQLTRLVRQAPPIL